MKRIFYYSVYFIFALSLILFILSVAAYYLFTFPLDSYKLHTSASVALDGIGFDVNDSALTFGIVSPGGTSLRKVSIVNNYKFPVRVKAISNGEIELLLKYPTITRIEPGENASIPVTFFAFDNSSYVNYSGSIELLVLRAD